MLIFWAVLGGFLLDALFGDPAWLPHPVVLMGRCISALEKQLRTALPKTPRGELVGGAGGRGAAAGHAGRYRACLLGRGKAPSGAGAGAANALVRPGAG